MDMRRGDADAFKRGAGTYVVVTGDSFFHRVRQLEIHVQGSGYSVELINNFRLRTCLTADIIMCQFSRHGPTLARGARNCTIPLSHLSACLVV